jgi:Methyltransferase domain
MFSLRTRAEPSPEAATEPEGGAEHARRCEAVRASGFFDGMWYLQTYPDVAAAGVDPLAHFIDYGSAEARSPGPGFNARWYLSQYADVRTSGLEPLFHFLWFGVQENRQPLPPRAQDAKGDVAEYWATERQGYLRSWLEHKVMLDFLHQRVSGDPKVENCEWFKRAYFAQPVKLALSLGCGFGPFERRAVQLGIAEKFHACDISPGAIKKATELAAEAGLSDKIEYSVRNVDELVLPENSYDAIFAISSAHHVFTLENLFIQCRRALKPGEPAGDRHHQPRARDAAAALSHEPVHQ